MYRTALVAFAVAAAACSFSVHVASAEDTVAIANQGGGYGDAMWKAVWEPTEKKLGVPIKQYSLIGLSDVRAQVSANAVQWDIGEAEVSECAMGVKEGLFEPLDYKVISPKGYPSEAINPNYINVNTASYVLGWNTNTFGSNGPKNWADFWDVKKFPGSRALRNSPGPNLEAALIADGVPLDKLYPLDVDRAFRKLQEIKPSITVWWTTGAQAAQLAKDGEVDMLSIWSNRMQGAINDGAKAEFTYAGGVLNPDCFFVPKGAKNRDLAMKALAIAVSPEVHANIVKYLPISPVSEQSYQFIDPKSAKTLPTSPENAAKQVWINAEWWAEHGPEVNERWTAFLQN